MSKRRAGARTQGRTMTTTTSAPNDLLEGVLRAFLGATGQWTGCDWPTEFGSLPVNVQGLTAAQVQLLARATSGEEAAQWQAVYRWLAGLEKEAREAEAHAEAAVALARAGQWLEALESANRAVALEAVYHQRPVWQPLREAIQASVAVLAPRG
jgi:hypothetical protein